MATVGIRELKNALSAYLKRARAGEVIEVTERGRLIARIVPAGIDEQTARIIAEGRATWSGRKPTLPKPFRLPHGAPLASDLIIEDRG